MKESGASGMESYKINHKNNLTAAHRIVSYKIRPINNTETVILDDYGHIEEGVPSLAISLYNEYRG